MFEFLNREGLLPVYIFSLLTAIGMNYLQNV